ncbi:TetR/AcrR family transcriptional regulator [Micromonospora sp. MED01]|uniref:TetR/AcrR family transcriptional regulator n=1 Tax=Micromonospora alfalfae TaxID=2911212 RepID=UPI001EE95A55|nr:TetR/AcrR family transcriptional regulator [Micromonospora alfalfae]MCG5466610.1 TetR/AcrR family transcriptional regulator [Micromonospora alfalfae]
MSHPPAKPTLRADAQQNVTKILDAAVACLSRNADASVSEIAKTAGVGRVTLYGHFPSRQALVDAALTRAIADGEHVLQALDLTGDPREALDALIKSSWLLVAQATAVLEAAQATLAPGRVQELHAGPAQRVDDLIRRGQADGAFRADLPANWLTSVLHHVIHGAAIDVAKGRLESTDAARFISQTILAAYSKAGA